MTHQPDIHIHELKPEDKYLVLASDGVWDELDRKTSAKVLNEKLNKDSKYKITRDICVLLKEETLNRACKANGISRPYLDRMPASSRRRDLVDDITIVAVNLQN